MSMTCARGGWREHTTDPSRLAETASTAEEVAAMRSVLGKAPSRRRGPKVAEIKRAPAAHTTTIDMHPHRSEERWLQHSGKVLKVRKIDMRDTGPAGRGRAASRRLIV
eukprot:4951829-Prymnesium_polylepis.2